MTNRQRMLVVTTLAPPTAGERVARTNRQRMLVVTTLAPPTVIAEILEVANNPNLNKNRGSTVRGDR